MRRTIPASVLAGLAALAGCERAQSVVIDCAIAGDAVDCTITRTSGDRSLEVCWDLEQSCKKPDKKRKAHICTAYPAFVEADAGDEPRAVPPGSKRAVVKRHVAPEEFQTHCEEDGIGSWVPPLRVQNVTFSLQ